MDIENRKCRWYKDVDFVLDIDRGSSNTAEHYILKHEDMIAADYPIPTFLDPTVVLPEGWHETRPGKENTAKKLIAVDCEMVCM